MPVEQKNLIWHGSAVMPDDDTILNIGGAEATSKKISWSPLDVTDEVKVISSSANDDAGGDANDFVTVYGRNTAGELVNEDIDLDGLTPVLGLIAFERLLKTIKNQAMDGDIAIMHTVNENSGTALGISADYIDLAAGASAVDNFYQFMVIRIPTASTGAGELRECVEYDGTLKRAYVRDWGTTPTGTITYEIATGMVLEQAAPDEIMESRRPFYNAAADPPGGSEKIYYEKCFPHNDHATLALTNATLAEVAEGLSAKLEFAMETTLDGTGTNGAGNNRQVAPSSGIGSFDSAEKDFANSKNFSPGSGQGVWLKLTLGAGDAGNNSFYKLLVKGQST